MATHVRYVTEPDKADALRVWRVPSAELAAELPVGSDCSAVAITRDDTLLAAGTLGQVTGEGLGPSRTISLWSIADCNLLCRWPAHDHQIHELAFLPDGRQLVSTSLDRMVKLWRLDRVGAGVPVEIARLKYGDLQFGSLVILSDGRIVVFRSHAIEIWRDLQQKVAELPTGIDCVTRWKLSADERLLAIARGQQTIEVCCLDSGRPHTRHTADIFRPEEVPGTHVAGQRRVTAGGYLWRTPGGNFIHVGDGPRGWATPLRLSPGGRYLILPCRSSAIVVDLEAEQRLVGEFPFEGRLRASCVTDDRILALNSEGKAFGVLRDAISRKT